MRIAPSSFAVSVAAGLAAVAALVSLTCAGCSVTSAPPAPAATPDGFGTGGPASAPSTTSSSQVVLPTVTAITPTGTIGTPDGVPSPAAAPDTSAASYADPVAVTTAWMQQYCQTDYQEPINGNVQRASVFATPAGTAADLAAGDTPEGYQQVVAEKVANRCSGITAQLDPDGPSGPSEGYVAVSATRTQLANGIPFQTMPLNSVRRVLRGADGRWLVDIAVDAG